MTADADLKPLPSPLARAPFIWGVACLGALVLAFATAFMTSIPKWIGAVPVAGGVLLALVIELQSSRSRSNSATEPEPKIVEEINDKPEYSSDFWLQIRRHKPSAGQLNLFEQMVPDTTERRKLFRMKTDRGEILLINAERFQELLVSRVVDDADKATDHALATAWHRGGGPDNPELECLIRKTFRDVVKADFRGNFVRLVSQVGEKILMELLLEAKQAEEDAAGGPFRLEPVLPPSRGRKKS